MPLVPYYGRRDWETPVQFRALTPAQRRRIQRADSETLLRWSEQVLFAQTADEALT